MNPSSNSSNKYSFKPFNIFKKKNNVSNNALSNASKNAPSNALKNAPSNASKNALSNASKNAPSNASKNAPLNDTKSNNPLVKSIKNINVKKVLIGLIIIILIGVIVFFLIKIVNYYNKECYEKKSLVKYLFDFSNNDICIQENAPVPATPVKLPNENNINILPIIERKKEVFHIANQDYTYEQAKCKCESYNGKLATKSQITDAYNNGANWCSYGWSDKQSAFYPVQKCEWDKMIEENHRLPNKDRKYCGVPGINGGFFSNPELKFGVNCYGVKPKGHISKEKKSYCPPMNFCKLESNFEASHKLDTDEIVGFNDEKWNESM